MCRLRGHHAFSRPSRGSYLQACRESKNLVASTSVLPPAAARSIQIGALAHLLCSGITLQTAIDSRRKPEYLSQRHEVEGDGQHGPGVSPIAAKQDLCEKGVVR